jgi:hypothetical protein
MANVIKMIKCLVRLRLGALKVKQVAMLNKTYAVKVV